jgi:uncharacterized membrane protein YphA (DoxX/SURF4 family)
MIDRMAPWRPLVGRLALGGVLLYFGVGEMWSPAQWMGYIPQPLHFLPAIPLLLAHGYLLFAVGGLLLLGAWTRPMSWLSVALLASIVAGLMVNGGGTSLYVRDLGLTALALVLALEPQPGYGLDSLFARAQERRPTRPMPRRRVARQG